MGMPFAESNGLRYFTFDLFSKIAVRPRKEKTDPEQAPLYKYITSDDANEVTSERVAADFTKFLISRDGKVVDRFEPEVRPSSKKVLEAVEAELEKRATPEPKK